VDFAFLVDWSSKQVDFWSSKLDMAPRRPTKQSANFVDVYNNEMGFEIRNAREQLRWENLTSGNRRVQVTQFLSLDAIRSLGLYDDLCRLFRRAGMLDFIERRDVTYPCLVLEFLVTIMRFEDMFTFRFCDMEYTLSCRDMSSVFGCVHGPAVPEYVELSVEGCAQFWMDVTAGTLDKKGGYSKEITHPILRLAHRMLAIPFYG